MRVLMLHLCLVYDDDGQSPLGPAMVYRVSSSAGATACADGEPYLHFRCGARLVGWAVGQHVVIALPKSLHGGQEYNVDPHMLSFDDLIDVTCGQRDWFDRRYEPEITVAMRQCGEQCVVAESCHHFYITARASERSLSGAEVGEGWEVEFPPGVSPHNPAGPRSSDMALSLDDLVDALDCSAEGLPESDGAESDGD